MDGQIISFIIGGLFGVGFMLYILFGSEENEKPKSEIRQQLEAGFGNYTHCGGDDEVQTR